MSPHRKKIGIIGAGAIGGTLAHLSFLKNLGDVVLFDLVPGLAEGKALDLAQSASLEGRCLLVKGSEDPRILQGCDVVIVTAGFPRKPGMSRSDLLLKNAEAIKAAGRIILEHAPSSFVIVVTNPLDAMVWLMWKITGFSSQKVVGMAGILDSARFSFFLSQHLNVPADQIQTLVLGGHGDLMVPLPSHTCVGGIPLQSLVAQGRLTESALQALIQRTRDGGGEIVALLKDRSAFYTPAACVLSMAEAYLTDSKRILPCAAWLEDEYHGVRHIYAGVPVTLGRFGVERVHTVPLDAGEQEAFRASAASVRALINTLQDWVSQNI